MSQKKPDWNLVDPLSTAVLVRYSRLFVTGVRARLGEEALQTLSGPQREKHIRLRAFRDKHIAHSVNAFEDNQPVARYWVERVKEEGITSVECNHTRIAGLAQTMLKLLLNNDGHVLVRDARLKEEKRKGLGDCKKMPAEEGLSGSRTTAS